MDLRSLMNNDSAEAARQPQQHPPQSHQLRESQQRNSIQPPPPLRTSSVASYGSSPSQHHHPYAPKPTPPLYQHSPPLESRTSNGSIAPPRLTPLQTPTQPPGNPSASNGYPFPNGSYQSPSQAQQQQYRAHDAFQAVTPGGSRPPAPLYQYSPRQSASSSHVAQNASSPYGAPQPPPVLRHSTSHSSMSPTPPVALHHHQTSQPPRETSVSASSQYGHHPYSANNQHPSQPSTPLGPPSSVQYPRPLVQAQSPYGNVHHRTSSGASYGLAQSVASNSPAQVMSIGHMAESPAAFAHQGLPKRATSGSYVSETERERSISVSPKTVVPRHGSQGSFYSSHDAMSARNSVSALQPEHDRMPNQIQPQHEPQHLRSSGDMSHDISPLTTTRPPPSSFHAPPAQSPSSRSSQTPKLNNLVNNGNMTQSPVRGPRPTSQSQDQEFSPHSRPPVYSHGPPGNNTFGAQTKTEPPSIKTGVPGFPQESLLQQPVTTPTPTYNPGPAPAADYGRPPVAMKRPAENSPEPGHATKRVKKRYPEPPIWARYSKRNPKYGDNPQSLAPPLHMQQAKKPSPRPPPSGNRTVAAQTNGHHGQHTVANGAPLMPMIIPRLGPWEYNIKNVQPMNEFLREVGDFLMMHATRDDIGAGDVRSGALEIEAKLGTLIDRQTNCRVSTLGTTRMVLDHGMTNNGRIRFESFMTETQHKQMNEYLNNAVQRSMEPHRVRMGYKHRYERDSFATLNQKGYDALPPSAKAQLRPGHRLKLRTTHDTKAPPGHPQYVVGPVLGRIVKIRLDDLDIHCPKMDFDCRISVNVEVDLANRDDIDPLSIVDEGAEGNEESAPARNKDRLSYQHLAYSVDLTQVTLPTGKKTHELEIELDSAKLREEAMRCIHGQENAYETMVDGLLSNVFTLMKAQKEAGAVTQGR